MLESLRMKRSVILSSESQLGGRRDERSGLSVVGLIPSRGNPAAPPPSLKTPRKNEEDTNRHTDFLFKLFPLPLLYLAFPNFILEEDTRHEMKSESTSSDRKWITCLFLSIEKILVSYFKINFPVRKI